MIEIKKNELEINFDVELLMQIKQYFDNIDSLLEGKNDFSYFENYKDYKYERAYFDTPVNNCYNMCKELGGTALKKRKALYNLNKKILDTVKKYIEELNKSDKYCSDLPDLPKFVPFFESSSNNLMIGGDLTGLNLSKGYDQASWALNNQNSETLNNEYINENDSTIGSIWFTDENGERQRIYDEGKTVAEICEEYGIDESALVFDIVRKSDGKSQAWIGYNQLTNIPDTSELDIEPNDNDNTSDTGKSISSGSFEKMGANDLVDEIPSMGVKDLVDEIPSVGVKDLVDEIPSVGVKDLVDEIPSKGVKDLVSKNTGIGQSNI